MDIERLISSARDTMTVRRVYGEPYEQDGLTVIPAALVIGGGGGGQGTRSDDEIGSGAGFGLWSEPIGAYVIRDGDVTFKPAIDLNRLAFFGLVALRLLLRRRRGR